MAEAARAGARILIVALSGRALAQSARRAGFVPIVLDRFADLDTREVAELALRIPPGRAGPLASGALSRAARGVAPPPVPLLVGGGLEGRPRLLAALARGRELLGNPPATVARAVDPFALCELCRALDVPFPETRAELPAERRGWLVKRAGAGGGWHVRPAEAVDRPHPLDYVQRRVPGRPVSILLLGDGRRVLALLASEQWNTGAPPHFKGVLAPAPLDEDSRARLARAAVAVGTALGLRGLASADFLLDEDGSFHLLEINPRPGGSLEAAEAALATNLVALHVAACRGRLPERPLRPEGGFRGTAIVRADRDLLVPEGFVWPEWAGDRTPPGTRISAGRPLATVRAGGDDARAVRRALAERERLLLARMLDARGRARHPAPAGGGER
ncbi:MAG: ATP-grasp domain-containing protein [Geminicoccaceae bacterium]|nr:ATP-grasp domain-containing protein [Geminicoccaceae bacterium]MDW8444068.1 ATP-grasp domain-containing protein [Acetobacteraceae bacterium]MCS7268149.1 ATP-grasp domain-containing protein [Geminicoccaceae bacterium]MCX7629613.1 ATP-grasp domain-containing protein [Geminicoccaceae bacterium]MDW8125386.1 ATP-grasp domain-containing protein [Geminicoccaceae bacterium]